MIPTIDEPKVQVTAAELISLAAADSDFYCRTFFPTTFRQKSPAFHTDMWNLLEDRKHRYVDIEVFRGGAKTTTLRTYTSKRISYGISRTIIFVSESQANSEKSIKWLKGQVDRNKIWTDVYGLERGSKWTENIIEIVHRPLNILITVIAVGITGQLRGINVEDYRPDLIVVDDPCDEENTATPEQRKKISDLFFGALDKSLTPATECPDAKMVLLQTPLNRDDLINQCHVDPQWASRKYGCFDPQGESRWPDRFPTDTLRQAKEAHIRRGQLGLWMREMECEIVAEETCDFRIDWLRYYEPYEEPKTTEMLTFIGIDPVPPPSERELAIGLRGKDFEVISVVGSFKENKYLLDISKSQDHSPEWTLTEFFRLVDRWRPLKVRVEATAYQRTLKWMLEKEMNLRRRWVQIDAAPDKRPKQHRIRQAYSGIASAGRFYVRKNYSSFIDQFVSYPNCNHDDELDSVAMALDAANGMRVDIEEDDHPLAQEAPEVGRWRYAP